MLKLGALILTTDVLDIATRVVNRRVDVSRWMHF